jgi:membrane fusion protein (multidrug efflux system)
MKRWLRVFLVILVVLAASGGLGYVAFTRYREKLLLVAGKEEQKLELKTPVAVSPVKVGSIDDTLVLNGEVFAETEVSIYSKVPGTVKEVLVREGGQVRKQDVLARIDRSEAGITYALTPVESTIDGIVKKTAVEQGDYVTPQVPLFQIIAVDEVEVVVHVPEREISRVRPGLRAVMRAISYPERRFSGTVTEVSPVVDPVSRTLEAKIRMPNVAGTLKPGMFGEVRIIIRSRAQAVVIPLAAVIERDGKKLVFVVQDGKVVMREPVLDIREGDWVSVREGLSPGQSVVVIGQHNVSDGDSVTVTENIE